MKRGTRIVHATTNTPMGQAAICDLDPQDVDTVVGYWHGSGDEFLTSLRIDRTLLGSEQDTRQRILRAVRRGDPDQQNLAFTITVNGELSGYTLLNRYAPDINYSHWHIINPHLRGTGISKALYPHRIKTYFDCVPIERLVHQTRTQNVGVNRMLDRFVPISETRYVEQPDGVALPGEFHIRYVLRKDIPTFFAKLQS